MFLHDNETAIDLLYYDIIAKTVVNTVIESKQRPITIGIHGDWGAGKSSVLAMAEKELGSQAGVLCIRFNGWQFQGFEDAKAALIESIITELRDAKKENEGLQQKALSILKRVDYLKLAKKGVPWIFSLVTGIPHPEQVKDAYSLLKGLVADGAQDFTLEKADSILKEAGSILKPGEEMKIPEQMRGFQAEFTELLEVAEVQKLVVLIDDLDRCLPNTAIETLEAIRLFLFAPKTAFVVAADEAMIEYAVRNHFPDLPATSGPTTYARNYLEKLIQVPFRIPSLGYAETQIYVALVLAQAGLGDDHEQFKKILERARQCLTQPWNAVALDHKAAKECLFVGSAGDLPAEISYAITVSQQISRLLTDGTKGNPRQIKRFLNSMMLRNEIATARGLSGDIKQPILAKIMLAESFNSTFYDQLTRAAYSQADGKPQKLHTLEVAARVQVKDTDMGNKAEPPSDPDDWAKSEWIRMWAKCDPQLAGVDLRPYMFVTRDKRNYFGGAAGTSHLDQIVEALFGGKQLAVKNVQSQLSKLALLEAEQVFDAVQNRIVQTDDYSQRPYGLIALVTAHASLQSKLLDFLRGIPPSRVPKWVMTGFDTVFTDPKLQAIWENTRDGWVTSGESRNLKAASEMVKPKRKR